MNIKKMKSKRSLTMLALASAGMVFLADCTKKDTVTTTTTPTPVLNTDTLNAIKGTATIQPIGGTAWDGTIGSEWNNAPKLTVHAVVPDLVNNNFSCYVGNATDVTMLSLYDANNIYFLVEFATDVKNVKSPQWYYNPATSDMTQKWQQESFDPVQNSDGTFRPPFQQDGFAMMFNVSYSKFLSQSCYALCHVNSSYGGTYTPMGGEMFTAGPTERTDVWRTRALQGYNINQSNDCFFDDGSAAQISGALNNLALNNDPQASGDTSVTDDDFSTLPNIQTLTIVGPGTFTTTNQINVPMYVIPDATAGHNPYSNSVLLVKDTMPSGAAKRVIAVDSNGVLTLVGGAKIDPRSGTDYKQVGSGDGPKCIPGSVVAAYTGSRGDITVNMFYTGSGWRILYKRALRTGDTVNDADFSSLSDQPFGIGAFFDGADNEHAIVAGLLLHFKK